MMILDLSAAIEAGVTSREIDAIADWHDDMAERAERTKDFERHDLLSFRLRKLANQLRQARLSAHTQAAA
jgi:hypothetical protein